MRPGPGHNPCCSLLAALAMVETETEAWGGGCARGPGPHCWLLDHGLAWAAGLGHLWASGLCMAQEEDGEVTAPSGGQDGGSEGLSYLPRAAQRPASQLGPCASSWSWLTSHSHPSPEHQELCLS